MKKIFGLLFMFLLLSCSEDTIKNEISNYDLGGFVAFKTPIATVDYQGGSGAVSYVAVDPNGNAVSYKIYKVEAVIQGFDLGEQAMDKVYTNFPADVNITLEEIAALYGLTANDITYGDSFRFYAEVTTTDGIVYAGESPSTDVEVPVRNLTTEDLLNPTYGYKQAMQFGVTVACQSFVAADMLGTWTWTIDDWDYPLVANDTYQCIQGSNPNEFIFVDFRNDQDVNPGVPSRSYDLVVNIDPATQSVVINKQENWNSAMYGLSYGIASVEGNGLVFTCIGRISMDLKHTVAAGSFGTYNLTLEKL